MHPPLCSLFMFEILGRTRDLVPQTDLILKVQVIPLEIFLNIVSSSPSDLMPKPEKMGKGKF